MRLQALTDPHPLSHFRVNGPLSNMPEFAAAFSCAQGDQWCGLKLNAVRCGNCPLRFIRVSLRLAMSGAKAHK
jgi:hypothetical protein